MVVSLLGPIRGVGKQECLARLIVFGNLAWEDGFPNAEVTFLSERSFDHTPMLIQFIKQPKGK